MKDRVFIVPHTHYEGAVFKTRAEYLAIGFPHILSALRILRIEPEYRFVLDQTAYIKPFLEQFPEEAPTVEKLVREGKLEITCGMDVMLDTNIPSGESFVRHALYGTRFARERLGVDVSVGWALDTFGHHPQMPQILRLAGFTSYFFSRGVPEHDAPSEFLWEGIDGSTVVACWLPFNYGLFKPLPPNDLEFAELAERTVAALRQHARGSVMVALSGTDMGAPDEELPARVRAFNAGDHSFELVIATPSEFLAALGDTDRLPRKRYDLNPVFPGCYTSRIRVKQENRRLEGLLLDCETLEAIGRLPRPSDATPAAATPAPDLLDLWEPVLFNQAHDLICGVQTDHVYADSLAAYNRVDYAARARLEQGFSALAARVDTRGPGVPLLVFNSLAWNRRDVAEVEIGFTEPGVATVGLVDDRGETIPCQIVEAERYPADGSLKRARIIWVADVPSLGYRVYHAVPNGATVGETDVSSNRAGRDPGRQRHSVEVMTGRIENAFFKIESDLWSGAITSLIDKRTGRELIDRSVFPGIVVSREQDHGDPWETNSVLKGAISVASERLVPPPSPATADLSSNYNGEGWTRHGPVMAEFCITHPFGSGTIAIEVRLYTELPRIDFRVRLVNQDEFVRYRAVIPTTIQQGQMTQEIPFGAVARPQTEYPAQNWTDLGDGKVGIAVLNRGLPGNEVRDNLLLLSLLRSTKIIRYPFHGGYEPGVPTDTGLEIGVPHTLEFALVPHAGSWEDAGLAQAGAAFNRPLLVRKSAPHDGPWPASTGLVDVSDTAAVVTAVKTGPNGDLIVRLYESTGRPASNVTITFASAVERAVETDLLERPTGDVVFQGNQIRFDLAPWQIKTFRVGLASV